jgi:hypothetical protein
MDSTLAQRWFLLCTFSCGLWFVFLPAWTRNVNRAHGPWEYRVSLLGPSPKFSSLPSAHITASSTGVRVCAYRIPPLQLSPTSSSELKELIALHSSVGEYGGDLRSDTVTIIGATLDLQEKTAIHVRSCAYLRNYTIDAAENFPGDD